MDKVTPESAWAAMVVIVAVLGSFVVVVNAIKGWKSINPNEEIRQKLANDKARLDSHEARLLALENAAEHDRDGLKVLVKAIMALVEHELHNGNSDQLQNSVKELTDWLMK